MPYSDCSSVKLAEGDTKVAIENMAVWAKKYQHHTKDLAVTFANKSLKTTCSTIHNFCYWYFQYSIDGKKQNLRSPACSWATRVEGIDCKSYSIIASTILLNLGIKHYFRRIKTSPVEGFSHVYVIVPIDQKQPKNLHKGYYVIDGTLPHTLEPSFSQNSDVFMEAELPIYGLAGGGGSPWGAIIQQAAQDLKPITEAVIGGLMDAIQGCGDAEYHLPEIKMRINRDLKEVLNKKIDDLQKAIEWNNRQRIQFVFNDLFKEFDLGVAHLRNETAYSHQDDCIAKTLVTVLDYIEKLKKVFDTFYENFKKSFTHYKVDEFEKSSSTADRTLYFVVGQGSDPVTAHYRYIVLRKAERTYPVDPILPYGEMGETFQKTSTDWLIKNKRHLNMTYSDGREKLYENEILPLIEKVGALRKDAFLGGEALYLFEQPIQREMYKVWLKYDDKYTEHLVQLAESFRTANELALRDYQERFNKEIEKDKAVKKRKRFKKIAGGIALAFTGFFLVENK